MAAADLDEARGKRNAAMLARQKFEQEAPKGAVGGASAPKGGPKKVGERAS